MLTYVIGDGTIQSSVQLNDKFSFNGNQFQTQLTCSPVTDSICYFNAYIAENDGGFPFRYDFSSTNRPKYNELTNDIYYMTSNYALNDNEAIYAGITLISGSFQNYLVFRQNFDTNSTVWAEYSAVLSKLLIKI